MTQIFTLRKSKVWEFPGVQWFGLGTLTAEGLGSIPGQGTKISHGSQCGQKKKKKKSKVNPKVTKGRL